MYETRLKNEQLLKLLTQAKQWIQNCHLLHLYEAISLEYVTTRRRSDWQELIKSLHHHCSSGLQRQIKNKKTNSSLDWNNNEQKQRYTLEMIWRPEPWPQEVSFQPILMISITVLWKYTFQKALAHKTCDVYKSMTNLFERKSNTQDQLTFSE